MSSRPLPILPISEILDDIRATLADNDRLVLEAPPGAGKTTLVPLALLNSPWLQNRKILMLEPRRVAAKTAALRMAALLGEELGERVGYTVRLEQRTSRNTLIEVVTEGVLTRRLQQDPELSDTALVIFDEFHERSIHSDLGLALCLQTREVFRDAQNPLRLLVMSATLNAAPIASLLNNAPRLRSEGRGYPVNIHYSASSAGDREQNKALAQTVLQAMESQAGSGLVFLPGQREIRQLQSALKNKLAASDALLPLYGNLPLAEQQKAIAPLNGKCEAQRKIVLATDIAETSLTIDGVTWVVDTGLARKPHFDPRTGMTRLSTQRISQASAAQRAGRAGRLAPGVCYRQWSETQQAQLVAHSTPEILQSDLAPLALQLLQWGVKNPKELSWLDTPPAAAYNQALDLLDFLGAIADRNRLQLSAHGELMASLPVHPRLAHLLIVAEKHQLLDTATLLAALVSESNPLNAATVDIEYPLDVLRGDIPCEKNAQAWRKRVLQQAKQYQHLLNKGQKTAQPIAPEKVPGFLIACAFPDRIARKREGHRCLYILANGRSAKLLDKDPLAGSEWLAVAEVGGFSGQTEDRIFSAARLDQTLFDSVLAGQVVEKPVLEWQGKRLLAETQRCVGAIILSRRTEKNISPQQRQQALLQAIQTRGLSLLGFNQEINQWRARVALVKKSLQQSSDWPDLSDQHLLKTLDSWLLPYIDKVQNLDELKKLDIKQLLQGLLPWPLPQQLDEWAPVRIKVPSGSSIAIDYSQTPPVLEVKLQEMFGCTDTPTIVQGKVKLLVHLLSPARRPLQITQDLKGFWQTSYADVKKEMKGRYPKHPWPDNPLEAVATRFTKKRVDKR